MPSRCVGALEPNLSLLYHRNVKVIDIFLSRLLLEGAGATISFVVLSVFFISIGWLDPPENILEVAGGWLMIAWFGTSLGVLLGAWSEVSETVEKLWHPAAYLLFPLSGAAFLVDALPVEAQKYVLLLPMVHGVEIIREGYFGSRIVAHYDVSYMGLWNLGLTWFALIFTRKVSETVVPQ
jgi:ABC-2 type transport system permease protein/capsular polysaccharide transport system permease protein